MTTSVIDIRNFKSETGIALEIPQRFSYAPFFSRSAGYSKYNTDSNYTKEQQNIKKNTSGSVGR